MKFLQSHKNIRKVFTSERMNRKEFREEYERKVCETLS